MVKPCHIITPFLVCLETFCMRISIKEGFIWKQTETDLSAVSICLFGSLVLIQMNQSSKAIISEFVLIKWFNLQKLFSDSPKWNSVLIWNEISLNVQMKSPFTDDIIQMFIDFQFPNFLLRWWLIDFKVSVWFKDSFVSV